MESEFPFYQPSHSFREIQSIIEQEFTVFNSYLDRGIPTFVVSRSPLSGDIKQSMIRIENNLQPYNYIPYLRSFPQEYVQYVARDELMLRVIPFAPKIKQKFPWKNLLLFIATIFTLGLSGYLSASNPLLDVLNPSHNVWLDTAMFAIAMFCIICFHELGHMTASKIHGVESSLPYFIPGPPPFGTFGALITQESPSMNRNELFDLGFAGPFLGFVVTLIVAIFGILISFIAPPAVVEPWITGPDPALQVIPEPIIFTLLILVLAETKIIVLQPGDLIILHPVAFAAWVGFLITGLNLFPIYQLDGGHISRSAFGPKVHKYISYIALAIMVLLGYWFMAIFLLFFMGRGEHPGPLDDVSKLSVKKSILAVFTFILAILCIPPFPIFSFF